MIADGEGRKYNNRKRNRKTRVFTGGKSLGSCLCPGSAWGLEGPRNPLPRAQPHQLHAQPQKACGEERVGWGPGESGSPGSARTSWVTLDQSLDFSAF